MIKESISKKEEAKVVKLKNKNLDCCPWRILREFKQFLYWSSLENIKIFRMYKPLHLDKLKIHFKKESESNKKVYEILREGCHL